jgi:hypothetical protein
MFSIGEYPLTIYSYGTILFVYYYLIIVLYGNVLYLYTLYRLSTILGTQSFTQAILFFIL